MLVFFANYILQLQQKGLGVGGWSLTSSVPIKNLAKQLYRSRNLLGSVEQLCRQSKGGSDCLLAVRLGFWCFRSHQWSIFMLESFVVFYLGVLMFSQSSGEHFCAGIVVGSVAPWISVFKPISFSIYVFKPISFSISVFKITINRIGMHSKQGYIKVGYSVCLSRK